VKKALDKNRMEEGAAALVEGFKSFSKVEAPIWLEISDCSYSETRFALTKNTRRK
jgi:hypothetical protein